MQAGVLRFLEFGRVLEAVRSLTRTPLGAARIEVLEPAVERPEVARQLAATSEGVRLIDRHGLLPLRAPADLAAHLEALVAPGLALEPLALLGLTDFLESVGESCALIDREGDRHPLLRAVAAGAASFRDETSAVRRQIDSAGDVADDASPRLKGIRERLRRQRAHLRNSLESYLRGRDTARYLQEQVVTDRNGRYVLVVRAEHRSDIPGIVHGASTSNTVRLVKRTT